MQYLERLRAGGWHRMGGVLAIGLAALVVLVLLFKHIDVTHHLTYGAAMVMLIYLTVGAFMVLAARVFVPHK